MKTIPQLVNLGLYDAALLHKNIVSTRPRRVSMYEIEFAVEDGGYSYIGEQRYEIEKGCVICAKPGQLRHTDLPYKCYFIHAIIADEELLPRVNAVPDWYLPSEPAKLEKALCGLIAEDTLPNWDGGLSRTAKFLEILSILMEDSRIGSQNAEHRHASMQLIQRALRFIDENYTHGITLDDMAAHVHLSKIYFHNLFLAATGQTPHDYLHSKRIGAVKFLLTTTDKPISAIASECGFSSQSYLNYVFKRETDCTPMQYKKQVSRMWDMD